MKTFGGRKGLATMAALVLSVAFVVSALGQGSTENASELADGPATKIVARKAQDPEHANAAAPLAPSAANNYAFATTTSGTFTDMSSGTTQLVAPTADDVSSSVTNIGFDFYLLGVRYTQFSVNSNGFVRLGGTAVSPLQFTLGTAGPALISAYGSDLIVSTTGKVHYKVTGSEPNRVLTIEFLDETIITDGGAGATADGTYQMRLYERTGVVEFVYGSMNRNSQPILDPQWVGFSTNSTDNSYVTVTTATNTANTIGAPASNQPPLSTPIANLNTPLDGSRRTYSFTPAIPTAPTGLSFTGITALAMTLNWIDSPDESLYTIYRSTDGINYSFETTLAQNTTSYPVSGLNPSTTYFWRVFAVSDGALSTDLSGNQATTAPGNIVSSLVGGNWSAPGTWVGGVVPTSSDNVTIVSGATVTLDTGNAFSVAVQSGGVLQFDATVAGTLTVGSFVTIDNGGVFQSAASGTQTGHTLSLGTDLTNNGTLDFSTNANTAGAGITFTGAANNSFSGTGATTDVRTITVDKGVSNANILELNPTNFTVRGVNTDVAGFLTLTNGTFKISGAFPMSNRVFTSPTYIIPPSGGIWLNNPNFTVPGQAGGTTTANNGLFRVSQGVYNIGVGAGDGMGGAAGAVFNIEGGTVNASGRIDPTTAVSYTQSGGTVNVGVVGNSRTNFGSFQLSSTLSSFTMSGGTINLVNANTAATPVDYRVLSNTVNFTGGTLNVGTAATVTNFTFRISGSTPNLVIDNTTNNKRATAIAAISNRGTVLVNTGTSYVLNGFQVSTLGATFTNNGTVNGTAAGSRMYWLGTGVAQTYTGTGVVTPVLASFEVDNALGVTIDATVSTIVTRRIVLFTGGVTNTNKLTLGNADATVNVIQIGNATTPSAAGNFDVAPTFNLGTGGQTINYLRTTTARTTGNEVNPTRTLVAMTYDDNDVTHTLTIAGGDLTLTSAAANALALTNGRVVTGANTLILNAGAAGVTRTTGYVDGNFRKNFSGVASKVFQVGTANGYSPVTVNATAGTGLFTVKATQGPQPNVNPSTSIQRYWTLTGSGITANLTFQYLAGDVMGNEANYRVIRVSSGTPVSFPTSVVTPATHTATLAGVSSFSDWTVGETTAPTAAPATISGQVTTAGGAPLAGVTMYLSGARSARTITDSNGKYRFVNVDTDNFYIVTPSITNYQFSPANRSFSLLADMTDAVFSGTRDAVTSGNVIDTPEYFVRQHYLDFLGREPDDAGLNFWSDQILGCGNDFNCVERRTINVSAAYFLSIEFRKTGGLVDSLYQASYGRVPLFSEFMPDQARVARDVIVNQTGWEALLASNTQEFLDAWVQRAAFRAAYDNLSDDSYVDTLIGNTGVDFTSAERAELLSGLTTGTLTRAQVLQRVAQNENFVKAKFNQQFVRMQYFGYLRRDPDDSGFNYWLNKLNEFDGNFEQAEMVKAFLVSGEYRDRFR